MIALAPILSVAYLDLVNEIVPKASAEGAYCIGLVSALAWRSGLDPTRAVLESAAGCKSIPDAILMFEQWRKLQGDRA